MTFRASASLAFACALAACNKSSASQAGASATPSADGSAKAATTSTAAASSKLVHTTIKKDECTFEVDSSEALEQKESDGMSVTYESANLRFEALSGSALEDFDSIASMTKEADRLFFEKERNPRLVIGKEGKANAKRAVEGYGSEKADGRQDGCTFFCGGTTAKERDVVAMCKSVKVTFTAKAK